MSRAVDSKRNIWEGGVNSFGGNKADMKPRDSELGRAFK